MSNLKKQRTFSISDEYDKIFEQRRDELGLTVTAYFEHLIDTEHKKAQAATPVEIVKDNPEHLQKIQELQQELDNEKQKSISNKAEKERAEHALTILQGTLQGNKIVATGVTALQLDPINIKILEYVAEREGKRRDQEWSTSDVVNYFIHSRFEKGALNGDLHSVPDSIIAEMRKELENV